MLESEQDKNFVERLRRREELLQHLRPGEIRQGVVRFIAHFGALVDLGDAEGLVHISQLSWEPIGHPSEVVRVGQQITVQVLSVDREKKKIFLSLRRAALVLSDNRAAMIAQHYRTEQVVHGIVTKVSPFGAFILIDNHVTGLIYHPHADENPDLLISLREQEPLPWHVVRIDEERQRLILGF